MSDFPRRLDALEGTNLGTEGRIRVPANGGENR